MLDEECNAAPLLELRPKAQALPEDGDVFPILSDMVALLKDIHTSLPVPI